MVVIEPDSLGDFNSKDLAPNAWAYLEGGNAGWVAADVMAQWLNGADLANAHGFALNSHLSAAKPFVVDNQPERQRHGERLVQPTRPQGRRHGSDRRRRGDAAVDQGPGDSDGDRGIGAGIPAGTFSPDLAIHLINGN